LTCWSNVFPNEMWVIEGGRESTGRLKLWPKVRWVIKGGVEIEKSIDSVNSLDNTT
jgi:hypothetical protein